MNKKELFVRYIEENGYFMFKSELREITMAFRSKPVNFFLYEEAEPNNPFDGIEHHRFTSEEIQSICNRARLSFHYDIRLGVITVCTIKKKIEFEKNNKLFREKLLEVIG